MIFSDEHIEKLRDAKNKVDSILKDFPDSKNRIVMHLTKAGAIINDVLMFQRTDVAKSNIPPE